MQRHCADATPAIHSAMTALTTYNHRSQHLCGAAQDDAAYMLGTVGGQRSLAANGQRRGPRLRARTDLARRPRRDHR